MKKQLRHISLQFLMENYQYENINEQVRIDATWLIKYFLETEWEKIILSST